MDMTMETLLFCIPYAGGSAHFFLPLVSFLPPWLKLVPLELPGRGIRSGEPLEDDFGKLTDDVAAQIRSHIRNGGPYALFGHSMGSMLAWAVARHLAEPPRHLFLSSPPLLHNRDVRLPESGIHTLPRGQFISYLRSLGGLSEEVLAAPELLEYVEPLLRADFAALEGFAPPSLPPLSIPITVLHGSGEASPFWSWSARTTGPFRLRSLEGGHFHLTAHWREIAGILVQALEQPVRTA